MSKINFKPHQEKEVYNNKYKTPSPMANRKIMNPMAMAMGGSADKVEVDDYKSLLAKVPALNALKESELNQILEHVEIRTFQDGEAIVAEGENGVDMFIIESGEAICTKVGINDGKPIKEYGPGDFFGERAMLVKEARAASIHASGIVTALALTNEAYSLVLNNEAAQEVLQEAGKGYGKVFAAFGKLANAFNPLAYPAEEVNKMEETFRTIDVDGSGEIDATELKLLMVELNKPSDDDTIAEMCLALDTDGDGTISLEEFTQWWLKSEGHGGAVLDGLNAMKSMGAAPVLIFYHLFDEDSEWFLKMGKKGIPLRIASDIITMTMNVFILLSTFSSTAETMAAYSPDCNKNPESCDEWSTRWWIINVTCTVMFTIEWVMKMVGAMAAEQAGDHVKDILVWVDLVSILPFYLNFVLDGLHLDTRWLRILRLSRLLRTLRMERLKNLAPVVGDILVQSGAALMAPLFFLCIATIIFSALTYNAEMAYSFVCELENGEVIDNWHPGIESPGNIGCQPDTNGKYDCACAGTLKYRMFDDIVRSSSAYSSIPMTTWWCIVTFTTVGYGDMMPQTTLGRIVGATAGLFGLLFMAMPLAIVGGSFHARYEKLEQMMADAKEAAALKAALLQQLNDEIANGSPESGGGAPTVDPLAGEKLDLMGHMKRCVDIIQVLESMGVETEEFGELTSAIDSALKAKVLKRDVSVDLASGMV